MFLFWPCHWHLMENTFMCSTNIKLTGTATVLKLPLSVGRANQQPVWISGCFSNIWLKTTIFNQKSLEHLGSDLSDKDNLCQIKLSPAVHKSGSEGHGERQTILIKDSVQEPWSSPPPPRHPPPPFLSSFSQRFPSLCVQPFHPLILLLFLSSSIPRSLRCTGFVWSVFPYTRSQGAQGQLHRQEEEALALAAQHSRRIPQEGRKEGVRRQIFDSHF